MTGIFGHRFVSAYGDDPRSVIADTWAKALADITPAQLAVGLQACAHGSDGWAPTLPDFRAFCLGIPSLAAVKVDIGRQNATRHPFTRLVWQHVDAHNFGQADQRTAMNMIREGYDHARELVMTGRHVLDFAPLQVLEAPSADPPKPATAAHVRAEFEDTARALGVPLREGAAL